MKTFAKIGLGLLAFGLAIAVLGAIVIRSSAPRAPTSATTNTTTSDTAAVASSLPQMSASSSAQSVGSASAAVQNSEKEKQ